MEALETLHGRGPVDFFEHCMVSAGYMLALGGLAKDEKQGKQMAEVALASGDAFKRFREFIQAQNGEVKFVDHADLLEKARFIQEVISPRSGYLAEINARETGETAVLLGGGRERKGDRIDYRVGVIVPAIAAARRGLVVELRGSVRVVDQSPQPGAEIEPGNTCLLTLGREEAPR